MFKIKDNVDLKELEKFDFNKIKGYPLQYKRKYKDLELNAIMYVLIDTRDNLFYITKDTYLLYELTKNDEKYIEDLIKADLVEKVGNENE